MNNLKTYSTLFGILLLLLGHLFGKSFAWDPDPTHKDITIYAAGNPVFSGDHLIKRQTYSIIAVGSPPRSLRGFLGIKPSNAHFFVQGRT
ncbi:MAG: hypothetical protein JRL30_23185 [Deltaproteobacteria bacterium]|nr:hypothetical protein [Deltaproteobacteria bacterium]